MRILILVLLLVACSEHPDPNYYIVSDYKYGKQGNYWVISDTGKIDIPFEYKFIGRSNNYFLLVTKDTLKKGILININNPGQPLLYLKSWNFSYHDIDIICGKEPGSDSLLLFDTKTGNKRYTDGDEAFSFNNKYLYLVNNGRRGLIDPECNEIVPPIFDDIADLSFGSLLNKLIDKYLAIPPPFYFRNIDTLVNHFEGYFFVKNNDKWGVYKTGQGVITRPRYDYITEFTPDYFIVRKDSLWGLIDTSGNVILPAEYSSICGMDEDLFYSCIISNLTPIGLYRNYNNDLKRYENARVISKNGLIRAKKNDLWGFVNVKNGSNFGFRYSDAMNFINGIAAVSQNGRWGFIDENGTQQSRCEYDNIEYYNNKICIVESEGKWLVLRRSDLKTVIHRLDSINPYYFGKAIVTKAGRQQILDTAGYITATDYIAINEFIHNIAWAYDGKHWVLMDERGRRINNKEYESHGPFLLDKNEIYSFANKDNMEYLLDTEGEIKAATHFDILAYEYLKSFDSYKRRYIVQRDSMWGVLDENLNVIIPLKYMQIDYNKYDNYFECETRNLNSTHYYSINGKLLWRRQF